MDQADELVSHVQGLGISTSMKESVKVDVQVTQDYSEESSEDVQQHSHPLVGTTERLESAPYEIVERPIKQPRPLRIVTVGAGIAGLALLYKTLNLPDIEVEVYEQFQDVGGVWLQNRYPGCSCDIPAHIYCYSFEGNPNWTR